MESVDYVATFIAVASDHTGPARVPEPRAGRPTVASASFELIHDEPYRHTSGDVIFNVWADRQGIPADERPDAKHAFYSIGRPCLRASDLGKSYGWGVHADADARLAVYPVGSAEYERLAAGVAPDGSPVTVVQAMRNRH